MWFLGGIDNLSTVIYNSCVLQLLVSAGGRELVGAGVRRSTVVVVQCGRGGADQRR